MRNPECQHAGTEAYLNGVDSPTAPISLGCRGDSWLAPCDPPTAGPACTPEGSPMRAARSDAELAEAELTAVVRVRLGPQLAPRAVVNDVAAERDGLESMGEMPLLAVDRLDGFRPDLVPHRCDAKGAPSEAIGRMVPCRRERGTFATRRPCSPDPAADQDVSGTIHRIRSAVTNRVKNLDIIRLNFATMMCTNRRGTGRRERHSGWGSGR